MPTSLFEVINADAPMICPFCRYGEHQYHFPHDEANYEGPTPEPGACWGWDRQSDKLCICEWRPDGRLLYDPTPAEAALIDAVLDA